ncbi:aminomethyltransferase family protein [Paracoccaceae bacterium]|nr:aminomethyltransferase family protein [Paracoccaceae bacterium]MDC0900411.1 aminomethyltransferase family protein [Paracoccaceae bacterium]
MMSMPELPFLKFDAVHSVYTGSKALSPFHECYANKDTILRLAAGRFFAHYNGEDIEEAYWALRNRAALFDVPERPVEISGPDVIEFLDQIFTRRSNQLKVGSGHYTLACTYKGGLFMDGILFRLDEKKFWFVHPDGDLNTWFLAHSNNYDVSISDPQSRVLQLQGPISLAIINSATDGNVDQNMGYFKTGLYSIGGQAVLISRTGWTGELGYEIYTLGRNTDYKRLWNDLTNSGKKYGMVFSSMQAMNIRRIEAGILDSGSDFDTSMAPDEAGLSRFIDRNKKCFIGCEAIKKRKQGNRIHGVVARNYIPRSGDLVHDQKNLLGYVTTGAYSPEFEAGIGYVRFDTAADWIGQDYFIGTLDSSKHPCKIVALPFYDKNKRIPKMSNLDLHESIILANNKKAGMN